MFQREDWTLFRNLTTISQKAGVPKAHLRRLALKELADNALDSSGNVELEEVSTNTYVVSDSGPGIPGGPEDIARLFSIARPLTSTKIVRLPVRGALGNGLRVVAGIVLASGGQLEVSTKGVAYTLEPHDDGTTRVVDTQPSSVTKGTAIKITFGPNMEKSGEDLHWAKLAKMFRFAKVYEGKTSAWWYDSDSFYELLLAAAGRSTAEVLEYFDGFGPKKQSAQTFVSKLGVADDPSQVSREQAGVLLKAMREVAPHIGPKKLGGVGKDISDAYAREEGTLEMAPGRKGIPAYLPFVVECWAVANNGEEEEDRIIAYVNGTPITGRMTIERRKAAAVAIFGCGLRNLIDGVSKKKCTVLLNVTTPYMPITTDGKEPDFSQYINPIYNVMRKATKKLRTLIRKSNPAGDSQTKIIVNNLYDAIDKASGNGQYRYSLRQLFYAIRPYILEGDADNRELDYNHFGRVITKYESENGELEGMYRDPRGTLYHPHLRQSIPIGTMAVEQYQRPEWSFNKVLYCEKEGFLHLLQTVNWPERHDCALLSSKGFASRAVRDVIDLLGEGTEEVTFFCIHDADASGTLIYQALQEGTLARGGRRVKIINLGLEAWEAVDMDLEIERFDRKGERKSPVANYVHDRDSDEGEQWAKWYQNNRVELNSMTSPQFLEWLDRKVAPYSKGKVVPPERVLEKKFKSRLKDVVADRLTRQILENAGFSDMLKIEYDNVVARANGMDLRGAVNEDLENNPHDLWDKPLDRLARKVASE